MKPGTYVLTADIANPAPDRRKKHDWRAVPTWTSGTEFLVEARQVDSKHSYAAITQVGSRWSHLTIGPGDVDQYAALSAALIPVEESIDAMFTRLDVHGNFAKWLVNSGHLHRDTFERLWGKYQSGEDAPSDEMLIAVRRVPAGD